MLEQTSGARIPIAWLGLASSHSQTGSAANAHNVSYSQQDVCVRDYFHPGKTPPLAPKVAR